MLKSGDIVQVRVEKIVNRGKGLARHENQVIFIPYSAPGDELKVEVVRVNKNFLDAEIVEILNPSSVRTKAPCPYYTQCGGCHFQHIHYATQVEVKDALVKETLSRALGDTPIRKWFSPVLSPQTFNYRNRIQVHLQNNKIGFLKRNSHTLIPIENCLIAEESINKSLQQVNLSEAFSHGDKVEILLDKNLRVHYRDLNSKGQPVLFSQVNRFANELLVNIVLERVKASSPGGKVYDLYSGDGNFLTAISKALPQNPCIGVELNTALVKLGRQALQDSNLNAHYAQTSVETFLETVSIGASDLIVLDPPRVGCDPRAMMVLGSSARNKVIYVSCEPTTLARDLRLLKETAGKWGLVLNIQSGQTLDMFPQTEHIETVVEFSIDKIDTLSTTH